MSVETYTKGGPFQIAPNFRSREFDCPCDECSETLIDPTLIARLQKMRDEIGTGLHITSGYRCAGYQEVLRLRGHETAKGKSTHELGQAADLMVIKQLKHVSGEELEHFAERAGFESIGIGPTWVHLDVRTGRRRWNYKK